VPIVDEAAMVSSRQIAELLLLAASNRARVVLRGDTQQIQSVETGNAMRVLEQGTQMKGVQSRQVQR
jgi:ATP-dependent exoDNAse (exonuclease V) alpha subunit